MPTKEPIIQKRGFHSHTLRADAYQHNTAQHSTAQHSTAHHDAQSTLLSRVFILDMIELLPVTNVIREVILSCWVWM